MEPRTPNWKRLEPRVHLTAEVLRKFARYNPGAWGIFHVVLDDGNVDDSSAEYCLLHAKERGDPQEIELARMLVRMSPTQRASLDERIYARLSDEEQEALAEEAWKAHQRRQREQTGI